MADIEIIDVPDQTVLGIRRKGHYRLIPELLAEIAIYAMEKGIAIIGPPVFVCHETSPEEVMQAMEAGTADVEVVVPVASPVAAPVAISKEGGEIVTCYELPGGPMAKAIHKGPYEGSESTYNDLFSWIEEHGKEITGPIREVYLNDPAEVGPEEILTEIYVPVG